MAAHGTQEAASGHQSLQGMAESQTLPAAGGAIGENGQESSWTLQLLPCGWQRQSPLAIRQGSDEAAAQMVESTKPEAKPDLAATEPVAGTSGVPASHGGGWQGLNRGGLREGPLFCASEYD